MAARKRRTAPTLPWQPDFRQSERLPDIKVVRTSFLLNAVAGFAFLLVLALVGMREWDYRTTSADLEVLRGQVAAREAEHQAALRQSAEFNRLSRAVEEVNAFQTLPIYPTRFLLRLSDTLPTGVLVESVGLDTRVLTRGRNTTEVYVVRMLGSVEGTPGAATQIINDYKNTLNDIAREPYGVDRIQLVSLERNPATGVFDYELLIEFSQP